MDYFDTVTTIVGYEDSQAAFDAVADEVLAMLGEYHRLYTIYHRFDGMENLCTVNDLTNGAHRTVTVDRRIIDLLLYAKEAHALTDGMTNVAMGSVLSLWHEYRTVGKDDPDRAALPPMDRLRAAAAHVENLVHIPEKALGECDVEFPYQVPENAFFMMGDQRATSIDSRSSVIGCVTTDQIIGKIICKFWPLSEFDWFV